MAKNQDITIEGSLPVVLSNGLNTNKAVDFSGSPLVNLPVNTVIAGVGNLVDTSSIQTLTNKTLANPTTITGAVISGATIGTSTVNGVTLSSTGSASLFLTQAGTYVSASAGNLTGVVTSIGTVTSFGTFTSATLASALSDETGSGSAVFATSPTLVTPALGTPTALVGTNISGTATSLTSGITNALASATTTVNVSSATAPTSGQVLTATSNTTATWQTSGAGIPTMKIATIFDVAARFTVVSTGSPSNSFTSNGYHMTTVGGGAAGTNISLGIISGSTFNVFDNNPIATWCANMEDVTSNSGTQFLIGAIGVSSNTITAKHVGFLILLTGLYASNADGTTQTISSSLATLNPGDTVSLKIAVTATLITFYYSINGGAYATTTSSTHIPTGQTSGQNAIVSVYNYATAANNHVIDAYSMTYER